MKNLIQSIPVKMRIFGIFSAVCLLVTGMILICENQILKELHDQQMAGRWSKDGKAAQISVFFAEGAVENRNYFREIEQSVEKALQTASIVNENEHARLWIDAVSRNGKVALSTSRATVELNAVGVYKEFFQFHPQKIVSGAMFSEDNMMKDGVIIDEETAWQLFGSSNVAGMQVMIGAVPHYITGVVERGQGRFEKAAGLEKPMCFLSMESLENYGTVTGGFTYEIVLPNPIKGFGFSTMQTAVGNGNQNVVVIENNTRFEIPALIKVLQSFGIRSMSLQGIVYPYWENIARGWEDILALLLLLKAILISVPLIFSVIMICYLWKHKTWTLEKGIHWMQDKAYEAGTRRVQKKTKRKRKKQEGKRCEK